MIENDNQSNNYDDELANGIKKNNEKVLTELVNIGENILKPYLVGKEVEEEDAKDIVQETLIKAITNIDTFSKEKGKFKTWLFKILRNTWIDKQRKDKRRHRSLHVQLDQVPGEELVSMDLLFGLASYPEVIKGIGYENPRIKIMKEAIEKIPERYKVLLELYYFENWSEIEIAKKFNIQEASVPKLVSRARLRLKDTIEEIEGELSELKRGL